MKTGFYPKLAWDAIRKNKRMYFPYMLTGSVMVMMFYILTSMLDSPDLQDIHGGSFLMDVLPFGCAVIAIFSLIFLFYTNSFLLKQRYREFGLYSVLGMDKGNLSRLMLWEGIYTAGIAIVAGLLCGIAFSKAAELILLNILCAEISFTLRIGGNAILLTVFIYAGIYILLLFTAIIKVWRSQPLALMQKSKSGEKKLRCNYLLAFAGVGILGYAYYMAVSIEEPATAMLLFFVAVILVILSTYLLFISGSVALCRLLQKNKKYYYRPNHFVSVSSMAYRMKRNGAGLASICILLTMVLVMLSSTASLYFSQEDSINRRYPNGINITCWFETLDGIGDDSLDMQKNIIARYAPAGTELSETRYAIASGQFTEDGITLDASHVERIDYDRVGYLYILSLADYNHRMGTNRDLAEGECLLYSNRLETQWNTFTMEYGETYLVKERLAEYREDGSTIATINPNVYIVVKDVAAFVSPIKNRVNSYGYSMVNYQWLCGFDCATAEEEIATKNALQEAIVENADDNHPWNTLYLESREEERFAFYEMYGSFFFLGIMLSVVFLMAAVLIIYYKQVSEGYEDQSRFAIMQKVGMTRQDIRRSVNSQMLTVFFLPLVMAGLHLGFAFPCISKILKLFAFDNLRLNITVNIACFSLFGLLYAVVYKITSGSYYTIVSGGKERL